MSSRALRPSGRCRCSPPAAQSRAEAAFPDGRPRRRADRRRQLLDRGRARPGRRGRGGDAARRGHAGHVGRRHRRRRGLLHGPAVAARRAARPRAGARTSSPRRATGWPSGSSARGSTMSRSGSASPTTRCFRRDSFDRIFLVHMYHEVTAPYAFLWHLREGLKAGGRGDRRRCRPAGEAPRHAAATC